MRRQHLLDDDRYLEWLTRGFVTFAPCSLTDADHDYFYRRAGDLYELAGRAGSPTAHLDIVGDNLRAQIPRLDDLLHDPAVDGALRSILGDDYLVHPHHFVHRAGLVDQGFHQDGNLPWNERGHYRPHRPDWALLFYYPQAVTLANGPTEVAPGSQYWTKDIELSDGDWRRGDPMDPKYRPDDPANADLAARDRRIARGLAQLGVPELERRFITVPKGTVAICSYDIVHRGSRTTEGEAPRYMYKFYFARAHEPARPSWRNECATPYLRGLRPELEPVVRQVWHWSRGERATEPGRQSFAELEHALLDGREDEKVAAAYRLAARGSQRACRLLQRALDVDEECVRRAACYGLRAIGVVGVPGLVRLCRSARTGTRRMAAYALGNAANAADEKAVSALLARLDGDPDDLVRSNTAYALGHVLRGEGPCTQAIVDALLARLEPGAEPNNTAVARLPRSTVRQSVAYALFQAAANGNMTADQVERMVRVSLSDADRYVQGFVVEALARIGKLRKRTNELVLETLARTRFNQTPAA